MVPNFPAPNSALGSLFPPTGVFANLMQLKNPELIRDPFYSHDERTRNIIIGFLGYLIYDCFLCLYHLDILGK